MNSPAKWQTQRILPFCVPFSEFFDVRMVTLLYEKERNQNQGWIRLLLGNRTRPQRQAMMTLKLNHALEGQ